MSDIPSSSSVSSFASLLPNADRMRASMVEIPTELLRVSPEFLTALRGVVRRRTQWSIRIAIAVLVAAVALLFVGARSARELVFPRKAAQPTAIEHALPPPAAPTPVILAAPVLYVNEPPSTSNASDEAAAFGKDKDKGNAVASKTKGKEPSRAAPSERRKAGRPASTKTAVR